MFNRLEPTDNFNVPQGLTFKNSTLWSHGICVLRIDLGTNNKFCRMQH